MWWKIKIKAGRTQIRSLNYYRCHFRWYQWWHRSWLLKYRWLSSLTSAFSPNAAMWADFQSKKFEGPYSSVGWAGGPYAEATVPNPEYGGCLLHVFLPLSASPLYCLCQLSYQIKAKGPKIYLKKKKVKVLQQWKLEPTAHQDQTPSWWCEGASNGTVEFIMLAQTPNCNLLPNGIKI